MSFHASVLCSSYVAAICAPGILEMSNDVVSANAFIFSIIK